MYIDVVQYSVVLSVWPDWVIHQHHGRADLSLLTSLLISNCDNLYHTNIFGLTLLAVCVCACSCVCVCVSVCVCVNMFNHHLPSFWFTDTHTHTHTHRHEHTQTSLLGIWQLLLIKAKNVIFHCHSLWRDLWQIWYMLFKSV